VVEFILVIGNIFSNEGGADGGEGREVDIDAMLAFTGGMELEYIERIIGFSMAAALICC